MRRSTCRSGAIRTSPRASTTPASTELRELSAHPRPAPSARPASTTSATTRRATTSAARSSRRSSWRRTLARPLVVHTREAADDTIDAARPPRRRACRVIIHCFSLSDRVEECVERRWYCSFAGNVTYPKATDLQRGRARVPDELLLAETDAPFLSPQERRSKPNEPAYVTATARYLADAAGYLLRRDGAPARRQRGPPLRLVSEARASLDRMSRHGIQPNRELGQNFLVDDNVLEVIGRTAELDPQDVVLEIGGGLGVLSAYLAPRVAPRARGRDRHAARARAARGAGGRQHRDALIGDVMKLRLGGLDPLPEQGGVEPSLRRRHAGDPADDRGAARRRRSGP